MDDDLEHIARLANNYKRLRLLDLFFIGAFIFIGYWVYHIDITQRERTVIINHAEKHMSMNEK